MTARREINWPPTRRLRWPWTGEVLAEHGNGIALTGSSPRGRGGRGRDQPGDGRGGLIPAWAGRSASWPHPGCAARAHPRVGGEVFSPAPRVDASSGSSPRGRGGLPVCAADRGGRGLIPAWAGRSQVWALRASAGRAHPRVGGEVSGRSILRTSWKGSSPRGRGGHRVRGRRPGAGGLIPAWAGRSCRPAWMGQSPRAHPRVGGEVQLWRAVTRDYEGSSPRGRGGHTELGGDRA